MLKYLTYPILKSSDSGYGSYSTTINTPRIDRDAERVLPSGLKNYDDYMANPLVYWAHEWAESMAAEPIGKTTTLSLVLKGAGRWHPQDHIDATVGFAPTIKAQNIRALVVGGFVSRSSIGFNPLEEELMEGVPTVTAWELMEHSVVPLPSNIDATITGAKSDVRWLADRMPTPPTAEHSEGTYALQTTLDPMRFVELLDEMRTSIKATDQGLLLVPDAKRVMAIGSPWVATKADDVPAPLTKDDLRAQIASLQPRLMVEEPDIEDVRLAVDMLREWLSVNEPVTLATRRIARLKGA